MAQAKASLLPGTLMVKIRSCSKVDNLPIQVFWFVVLCELTTDWPKGEEGKEECLVLFPNLLQNSIMITVSFVAT